MNCNNCGAPLEAETKFCPACGTAAEQPAAEPVVPVAAEPMAQPEPVQAKPMTEADLPEEYRPLGPWSYFWLEILFMIPVIGFIFLIIFSFKRSNINRRNFARSYWIIWIIAGSIGLLVLVLALLLGHSVGMTSPAMAL